MHSEQLNKVFAALADPTRRAILARLAEGEATVIQLTEPFDISQPAISKHLKVLEQAGLVERGAEKTRRPARLQAEPLSDAVTWLEQFSAFWTDSFHQLDSLLLQMQQPQNQGTKDE